MIGLTNASEADLNGDGVADLWGETGGELRAFRGEAPEPGEHWVISSRPATNDRSRGIFGSSEVDFDRDGVPDALISELAAQGLKSIAQPAAARRRLVPGGTGT